MQVTLTGYPDEPDPRWRGCCTGTHHRVRPTQRDHAHSIELRWAEHPTTTAPGTAATPLVELDNTGSD